jgi:hypothetical protein
MLNTVVKYVAATALQDESFDPASSAVLCGRVVLSLTLVWFGLWPFEFQHTNLSSIWLASLANLCCSGI